MAQNDPGPLIPNQPVHSELRGAETSWEVVIVGSVAKVVSEMDEPLCSKAKSEDFGHFPFHMSEKGKMTPKLQFKQPSTEAS